MKLLKHKCTPPENKYCFEKGSSEVLLNPHVHLTSMTSLTHQITRGKIQTTQIQVNRSHLYSGHAESEHLERLLCESPCPNEFNLHHLWDQRSDIQHLGFLFPKNLPYTSIPLPTFYIGGQYICILHYRSTVPPPHPLPYLAYALVVVGNGLMAGLTLEAGQLEKERRLSAHFEHLDRLIAL